MDQQILCLKFIADKYTAHDGWIKISGKKMPPPSKRITLQQKGLKIADAKIIRHDKRGDQAFTIVRINHLPTMQQVRIHTKEVLFPGDYDVQIMLKS